MPPAPVAQDGPTGALTILSVNDTYRIEGLPESGSGGMARLRTLRSQLEAQGPVLVLHGGDLLFPSLLSSAYKGRQMTDVMGLLDGDAQASDPYLFATFGNHEFDKGKDKDAAALSQTIDEAGFTWLSANIEWASGEDGRPMIAADNLVPTALVELGGLTVGLLGITGDFEHPSYVTAFEDPVAVARRESAALRQAGADLVVALTHLEWQSDLALLEELGSEGPDLVVGGHDHSQMLKQASTGAWVVKGNSDATSAVVTRVQRTGGVLQIQPELVALDRAVAPDPAVQAKVLDWLDQHERRFCQEHEEPFPCLEAVLGHTNTVLTAEESAIRSRETSLGSWAADLALAAYADQGAQVAFLNSGSLRLNKDLPPDTAITRRHLEELLPYPSDLVLLRLDGATLQQVVDNSTVGFPGAGRWLQVAGMAFRHDPQANAVSELSLVTAEGLRPVQPEDEVLAVAAGYIAGGGDGYTMLVDAERVAEGETLRALIEAALAEAGDQGISPATDGRICQGPVSCLFDQAGP